MDISVHKSIFSKGCIFAIAFMAVSTNLFGQIQSGSAYTIVNRATAQAVDDPGGTNAPGTRQEEVPCDGNAEQNWTFTANGSYYTIQNTQSLLYLDTSGSEIVEKSKSGGTTQNWTVSYIGNGFYEISNESSGDVLDVPSGTTVNGTPLDQTTNSDDPWQQWYITTAGTCRTGQYSSSSSGWAGVSIPGPGSGQTMNLLALFGTLTMTNANNSFAEALFGMGFVPNGMGCANTSANLPPSSWSYILKSVTAQTISVPISYWKFGGLGVPAPTGSSNCLFMGFDGPPAAPGGATVNLAAIVAAETTNSVPVQDIGMGYEICFNESSCATKGSGQNIHPETNYFEWFQTVPTPGTLDYIWGDISDAAITTPNGTWVTKTNLYVFHSGECSTGYSDPTWSTSIPGDANLLINLPETGVGSASVYQTVFQILNYPLKAGDCLVLTTFVPTDPGNAQFNAEVQLYAVVTPN
jgi:hypothetical protein